MSDMIDIDGVLVDADTGEVLDLPTGTDIMAWRAARLMDAIEQQRAWERAVGALKAGFVRDQADRKAQYGDVVVSVRQNMRREFAPEAFRAWLEDAQLDGGALLQLALAARAFDVATIEDRLVRDAVARHVVEKPTRPFAVAERVRRAAPRVREMQEVTT